MARALLVLCVLLGAASVGRAQPVCADLDAVAAEVRAMDARVAAERAPGGLQLRLHSNEGPVLAERFLRDDAPCADLLAAARVLLATWQTSASVLPPGRLTLRRGAELDLGAAFAATFARTDFAPGGAIALHVGRRRGRVLARVAVWGAAPHDIPLGVGRIELGRALFALGAVVRFRPSRLVVDLRAEGVLGLAVLQAAGFTENARAVAFDPALGGGARLGVRIGRWLPFIDVGAYGFVREQRAVITGVDAAAVMPRVEVSTAVGVAGFVLR